ncbi:hypothetical protein EBR03_06265 [bacterium]|nr:hypothetical protein [bacterium]NBX83150.1 hypothetical protein [bacterium]
MIPATFKEAQTALTEFLPRAGSYYAQERNFDRGPHDRSNVSQLSSVLSHRVLSEKEVLEAVLKTHSWPAAEKFLQEVLWRSYWKSWLELRPSVWKHYSAASQNQKMTPALSLALSGETGIACFDFWRKELRETGYLHNHARMWFASIWIFTLKQPWEIGARLFENELLDFDAASNTLSWRWVAGLHTPGKHYVARAENIEKFTEGRFHPEGQLDEAAQAFPFQALPIEPTSEKLTPAVLKTGRWGLLVHEEDFSLERTQLKDWPIAALALWDPQAYWPSTKSPVVKKYFQTMQQDAVQRLSQQFKKPVREFSAGPLAGVLQEWVKTEKLDGVVLVKPWQGRLLEAWEKTQQELAGACVPLYYLRRDYDAAFLGKAKAGFFSFKETMKDAITPLANAPAFALETVWQTT